jgi:signal transduction histidine kinase
MPDFPPRRVAEGPTADARDPFGLKDAAGLERRVGQFLRELAHELGNLAFPLQMILDLQGRSKQLSPDELQAALQGHISELLAMTRRFQRIGRCIAGGIEPQFDAVRATDVVHGAVDDCRPVLDERGLRLHLELADTRAAIYADRELLQLAVAELIDNSARFSPPGGRVDVAVARSGGFVEFQVCDSGPGIAPELAPHVFELFTHGRQRLDFASGRVGGGLTIVQRIAAAHRGSAEVRRSSPDGTEVVICVPAE